MPAQPVIPVGRARSPLARPATVWTLLSASLAMYLLFAVLFYTPITPASFYGNGNNLAALWTLPIAAFAVIGALIALRRPGNPIGWLCLAGGTVGGLANLASEVGSLLEHAHVAAGGYVLAISAPTGMAVGGGFGGVIILTLLLFPDGHLVSRRWRWVAGAAIAVMAGGLALNVVDPTPGNLGESGREVSALAIPGADRVVSALGPPVNLAILALGVATLVSMVLRLRGADADRRHQVKWVAFAGVAPIVVLSVLSLFPQPPGPAPLVNAIAAGLTALSIMAIPVAIGVGVLKYRLYDIDVIISRTLVYGTLAVLITAVYIGIAVGIGTLVGSGGQPNLFLSIAATIVVAVGFQPVRERLQRVANRLVYGKRATPYEVLSEFSGQVAETYAADDVLPRMARVLQDGTGAEAATVWLRSGPQLRPAATFPDTFVGYEPLSMSNGTLPDLPGATGSVEVRYQGELLGALSVIKRRGETLTHTEAKLIDDLAHQAGLVLRNVGLTDELLRRLEELRTSRGRLVQAQDNERRRLERNLHDGAQQHLVAIKVKLGLAQMLVSTAPDKAKATVLELKADADEALETLRDLARGIYPPLLADRGVVAALESQARKSTVPARVKAAGIGRYPQDVESTVYFCVLEALQNVQKYAGASLATVRLDDDAGAVHIEVEDDGQGFDLSSAQHGTGLTNMIDRLAAMGGTLTVDSAPGHGTRLRVVLPVGVLSAA